MAYLSIETRKLANKEQRFKAVIIVKNKGGYHTQRSPNFQKERTGPNLGGKTKPKRWKSLALTSIKPV
jgi:hypothetical protein